jgi:hypothetical protein
MGYNGENWQEISTQHGEGLASGSSALMDAYLLIKK